jgi:hypothetical protein
MGNVYGKRILVEGRTTVPLVRRSDCLVSVSLPAVTSLTSLLPFVCYLVARLLTHLSASHPAGNLSFPLHRFYKHTAISTSTHNSRIQNKRNVPDT